MKREKYNDYNLSFWYLLPLLSESNETEINFLIHTHLIDVYIATDDFNEERGLVLRYKWEDSELFKNLEERLTQDLNGNTYIKTTDISSNEVLFCYNITNATPYQDNPKLEKGSCIVDYDTIMRGEYSKMSTIYKLRIIQFFGFTNKEANSNFIILLMRRDKSLWHTRAKNLGCNKEVCKCTINVEEKLVGNILALITPDNQSYLHCSYWCKWKMPEDVELEEKINRDKETFKLEQYDFNRV